MTQQQGQEHSLIMAESDQQTADSPVRHTFREVRSSSPAKRRASEMDDNHMDVERSEPEKQSTQQNGDSTSKSSSKQHTREASVDMLSTTNGTSKAASTNPSSVSETPADQEMEDAVVMPSINEQVGIIMSNMKSVPDDGDVGFVVATKWIERVLARSSQKDTHGPFDKDVLEGEIGPIDNSALLLNRASSALTDETGENFIQLRPGLSNGSEYEIFSEEAFTYAQKWYGLAPGQSPIKRTAHANNPDGVDKNVQFEVYPPVFALRKVQPQGILDKHTAEEGRQRAPKIVSSRNSPFQAFLRRAKETAGVPLDRKVKLWRVLNPEAVATDIKITVTSENAIPSPPESRDPSPSGQAPTLPLLIKSEAFKAMPEAVEREMIDMKDETANEKYNGSVDLGTLGLGTDQILIIEEQASNGSFVSDATRKGAKAGTKKGGLLSGASSGRSSPALGPITRGRNRASGRTQGSVGLSNLGNTCYMNSALQCIRATEELTCFFLAKGWKKELNKSNPLGYEGKMASTYAALLDSIYDTNSSSFTPSDFKRMLSKCGPQFSGYGQQDSQEFASFLIDALHEDMNRIHKKPYIENPDSDDTRVHDDDYIKELGDIYKENYHKRNSSVILDLFNGFYKNTMVCPTCDKISVTFDPYLLLTLQLPIEHSWQHTVNYIPLRGDPVRIDIDMDKHATIGQLKAYVATKVPGLDAKRVMMAEVFSKKFYRTVEDKQTIAEANITQRDEMFLYELDEAPTNFPPPKKKKRGGYTGMLFSNNDDEEEIPDDDESPLGDVMMVPVFQRAQGQYGNSRSLVNTPFFVTVNRDEAHNYLEIYRKVLARIANLTTRDILHELSSSTSSSDIDEEDELQGDRASTTDVQTRSVESEDGAVEVTLSNGDASYATPSRTTESSTTVLEPGAPIPSALLELFELKVMPKGSEMVPTGFQGIDERKAYASLSSRLPKVSKPVANDADTPATSESSDADDDTVPSAQPSFTDGNASDGDDDFVMASARTKKQRTYGGKQGRRPVNGAKTNSTSDTEHFSLDYEATDKQILHIGECLIVDWSHDHYDGCFEGHGSDDNMRGQSKVHKNMSMLEDAELADKRRERLERKKNGISLDECFKVSSRGEILTEDNAWYCNRCKELRQAQKTLEIWTAPDILVIHLKRFSAARQFRDKIDILVDFPTEGLNLNDKVGMREDDKDLTYDLFGVDNHYGGLGGGHYTAYAKNFVDEEWYEYNDSSVSKRNASSVVTSAAYLLFYRRRSSEYLGGPDLQKLVARFRSEDEDDEVTDLDENSESRTASPSGQGKGHRLGGSSLLTGSSSSSAGQGAGRLQGRRGGDHGFAAATGVGQGMLVKSGNSLGLDGYEGEDEDEAINMDEVDDPPPASQRVTYGPQPPPYTAKQTWGWDGVVKDSQDAAADSDNDSNVAMIDDVVDDGDTRLLGDFGDELGLQSAHNNSPGVVPTTETDFNMDDVHAHEFEDVLVDDAPVVEIRVDSPPHDKKE